MRGLLSTYAGEMTLKLLFAFINDVITFTLNKTNRKIINNNELFASFA